MMMMRRMQRVHVSQFCDTYTLMMMTVIMMMTVVVAAMVACQRLREDKNCRVAAI